MTVGSLENFKGCILGRPPLVVFVTCLGLFAVILMSLAYYVKLAEDIPDPDAEGWNTFLGKFAKLEFCIQNNTESTTSAPVSTRDALEEDGQSPTVSTTTEGTTTLADDMVKNYSVQMLLTVQPTKEFVSIPHNLTFLTGSITGDQIGLKGSLADEQINVTMTLPWDWNATHCDTQNGCPPVQLLTCVSFQAASNAFPATKCPDGCEKMNDTGVEYHTRVEAQTPNVYMIQAHYCKAKPVVRLEYKLDPKLTVYLKLRDRSVINLHLLHTSYFLFVMVVTLLLYALIKGRPLGIKVAHHDQQKLLQQNDA